MPAIGDQTANTDVPPIVADAFVTFMHDRDIVLDYSLESLTGALETALDLKLYRPDVAVSVRVQDNDMRFDLKSAASAYLGETLARRFNGAWAGYFASNWGANYYTSQMMFGDYCLNPIHWLLYRVSNGRKGGSVADWLARVTPSIKARQDLNP